ncbi:MAG: hypothetical protein H6754_01740 [Candidatus Omnitrophica bacterium]|nr:hypothetical protein [Candidatus Omnitrophota bacterium]
MSALILIIAFFVILTFVIGASLLFRGYENIASGEIAPAGELKKTQADLKLSKDETEKLRVQANSLAVGLEEMKSKLAWAQGNVKTLEETIGKAAETQARLNQIEMDLNFLSQKADSQAREAIDVITRLAAERDALQKTITEKTATTNTAQVTQLTDENSKLKIQIDGYASKVKDLEAVVKSAQDAASQVAVAEEELKKVRLQNEERVVQANAALVKINSEVELLNSQIMEKDQRIKKFTEEAFSIKDKEDLQKRLDDMQAANQHLRDKEKVLTYKLAQSRAQAMTLEKICEEFKQQVGG